MKMIYLEKLNSDKLEAIAQLQARIINDLPNDMLPMLVDGALLYRFLKAKDFDVDKAEQMLKRHITWRKHFQMATIVEDFTPRTFFEQFIKMSDIGLDKDGNMIMYLPLGNFDVRDVFKCVQRNEFIKHCMWLLEKNLLQARKLNRQHLNKAVEVTFIFNMDNLTLENVTNKDTIECSVRLMRLLLDNYPEVLNAAYVINTPAYFTFIWSLLKPMLSSTMTQKIHIYNYSGWQEKLLEAINADVLPAFLGGNRTDPDGDPLCKTLVTHGGRIPESCYLLEEERDFTCRSLVKQKTISSRQKEEIVIHVAEIGWRIHWEFLVKTKDIGFGIFHKLSAMELKEILPIERYDTVDGVEKGSYKIHSKGNYVIVFDNTYSLVTPKDVDYCIKVLKS